MAVAQSPIHEKERDKFLRKKGLTNIIKERTVMIRTFKVTVQGVCYEVKIEQITPAAIAARSIIPPPAPKNEKSAAKRPTPLFQNRA